MFILSVVNYIGNGSLFQNVSHSVHSVLISIMHNYYYMVCFLQGAVAKKPYNPILGETFRCYWDLPGGRRNAPDDDSKVHHPHVHLSPSLPPTSPSQFYYDTVNVVQ